MSTGVSKIVAQRNQRILLELTLQPGNDICADCKARAPRWASYNLGIFICVNCASIHRKIGTHITKVKSITLDEWSKEQVQVMKERGNIKANDSERDSELEKFIRSKYEFRRFMDRKSSSISQQSLADPSAASARSRPTLLTDSAQIVRGTSPGPPLPPKTPENLPPALRHSATIPSLHNAPPPMRSASQPFPRLTTSGTLSAVPPFERPAAAPGGQVWEDLISLQEPSQSSSLPLQYNPVTCIAPFQPHVPLEQQPMTGNAPNPFLSLGQVFPTTPLVASPVSASTPGLQFPLAPTTPLSSPALHPGANPFNQAFSSPSASIHGTTFPTSSNPFSSSPMPVSTTPSLQPFVALPTGALMQTQPLYVPSQTSTPAPTLPSPFVPAPTPAGLAHNPFTPVGAPGQVPLLGSVATNPFSAMQVGQAGFPGMTPPVLSRQQQQGSTHGFNAWAGQGVHGTF